MQKSFQNKPLPESFTTIFLLRKGFSCAIFLAKCDKASAVFEATFLKGGARWKAIFFLRKI
jgi:hypothetical protein